MNLSKCMRSFPNKCELPIYNVYITHHRFNCPDFKSSFIFWI